MLHTLTQLWNEPHGRSALFFLLCTAAAWSLSRLLLRKKKSQRPEDKSSAQPVIPGTTVPDTALAIGSAFWEAFAPRLPFLLTFCGLSFAFNEVLLFLKISPPGSENIPVSLGLILAAAMAARAALFAVEYALLLRYNLQEPLHPDVRAVVTRVRVLRKLAVFGIALIALASCLMLFPSVSAIGGSLLASAGLAGIIVGFAAQKTLSNVFAGLQLALTQPIRLGDSVFIEGESGTVEEITLTYVVIRLWDLRGLVLPISYFLEKPFQNWSRSSNNRLTGTVLLQVSYFLPVEPLRNKAKEIVAASPHWDGQLCDVVVTALNRDSVELRITASAYTSGSCWNLRCEVREKILHYLQTEHHDQLPHFNLESRPQ